MSNVTPAELRRAFLAHLEGDLAAAEAIYRRAAEAGQFGAVPYRHLVRLLRVQHRWNEAIEAARQGLARRPDPEMALALGQLLLSEGRYAEGWPHYERRAEGPAGGLRPRDLPFPEWDGGEVDSLVVFREQGAGDTIQFARFLPQLAARGIRLELMAQPEVAPLLGGLGATVHPIRGSLPVPSADAWAMICSLPYRLGVTLEDLPGGSAYLSAPADRRAAWAGRLPKGARIGVVSSGNPGHPNDRERSMPLEGGAILLSLPGAISLRPEDGGLPVRDFADTAAIVEQLDLVITVDTALAHLAGALGKPCWVLLPHAHTDWRWLHDRTDSPWYPSLKLYRQPRAGDWASVLRAVAQDLQPFLQPRA